MIFFGRKKELAEKWLMTLAITALTLFRRPELLVQPRFYAEEGTNFFHQAYNNSFAYNLLHPLFGYYTLHNVLATSLAARFPLDHAPLVTTVAALLAQLATVLYVIWGDIPVLDTVLKRAVVAVACPLFCPGQIWLTTIGVQYWLTLLTFFILLGNPAPVKSGLARHLPCVTLLLNGLTGVLSCLMTPLFLFKFIRSGSRRFLSYTCLLAVCSLLQLGVYLNACLRHDPGLSARFLSRGPVHSVLLIYDSVVSLLCTYTITAFTFGPLMENSWRPLLDASLARLVQPVELRDGESVMVIVALCTLALVIQALLRCPKNIDTSCMQWALLIVYPLSMLLSINSIGGPRYIYAPSIMLFTIIIVSWEGAPQGWLRNAVIALFVAASFGANAMDYRTASLSKAYNGSWPKWREEVAVWKKEMNYPLRIWPPPWVMTLEKPTAISQNSTGKRGQAHDKLPFP